MISAIVVAGVAAVIGYFAGVFFIGGLAASVIAAIVAGVVFGYLAWRFKVSFDDISV